MKATYEQLKIASLEIMREYGDLENGVHSTAPKNGVVRVYVQKKETFDMIPNPYRTPKLPGIEITLECVIDEPPVLHGR